MLASQILHEDVSFAFQVPFEWNINDASKAIAHWLISKDPQPTFSVVGLMSSHGFRRMITLHVNARISSAFKLFVYVSSYIHVWSREEDYPPQQLAYFRLIGDVAARQVLLALDSTLRSFRLDLSTPKKRSKWQAMFLLLLGTIIVVQYDQNRVRIPIANIPSTVLC